MQKVINTSELHSCGCSETEDLRDFVQLAKPSTSTDEGRHQLILYLSFHYKKVNEIEQYY
jgi:hypothetical protein